VVPPIFRVAHLLQTEGGKRSNLLEGDHQGSHQVHHASISYQQRALPTVTWSGRVPLHLLQALTGTG